MKFLFLTASFYPHRGGVERHAGEVACELIRRGHEVSVVTESALPQETRDTHDGIRIVRVFFGATGKLKKFRIWLRMVRDDMRSMVDQADVVVCHDVFVWYVPMRFLFPHKRVLTVFHGYETRVPPLRSAVWIRRMSALLSTKVMHVGSYVHTWYGTRADVTLYEPGSSIHHQPKGDPIKKPVRIALIGRLADDMGIGVYAEAFTHLRDWGVAYKLDVYGSGPLESVLEPFGKLHGVVDDVEGAIRNADVVCASGYLSLFEAMRQHKVCFAVYENELKKEYLRDSCVGEWVWTGHDSRELARAIQSSQTWSSSQKKQLSAEMIKHSWKAVTDWYEKLCA